MREAKGRHDWVYAWTDMPVSGVHGRFGARF